MSGPGEIDVEEIQSMQMQPLPSAAAIALKDLAASPAGESSAGASAQGEAAANAPGAPGGAAAPDISSAPSTPRLPGEDVRTQLPPDSPLLRNEAVRAAVAERPAYTNLEAAAEHQQAADLMGIYGECTKQRDYQICTCVGC